MIIKNPKLYSPENVDRARFAQIGVTVLAVAVSGYLVFSTLSSVRKVWNARSMLTSARLESGNISRKVSALRCEENRQSANSNGGVDVFALQMSRWATEQGVKVEAVTPQGAPTSNDITIDNLSLGTWNAVKVRVEGSGDFPRVMSMLNRLRDPKIPVQLESFSFQSVSGGQTGAVTFDLMLTVYEKKIQTS